jgi:hypothetical protein
VILSWPDEKISPRCDGGARDAANAASTCALALSQLLPKNFQLTLTPLLPLAWQLSLGKQTPQFRAKTQNFNKDWEPKKTKA